MSLHAPKAVMLALSFVVLVGGAVQWWILRHPRSKADVTPVLSEGELMKYVTYGRLCRTSKECEPPLVCTIDEREQNRICLTSECETDLQCPPGFLCRTARAHPIVRLCLAAGTRVEGERCNRGAPFANESCGAGLVCMRGHCGRSCRLGEPGSCPPGFGCVDSPDGPACVSQCTRETCPPPKTCVRFDAELAVCGTLVTSNCDETPCPEGQVCDRAMPGMKDRLAMRCVPSCRPDKPCAPGSYCEGNMCMRLCEKDEECGPLEECVRTPSLNLSMCRLRGG